MPDGHDSTPDTNDGEAVATATAATDPVTAPGSGEHEGHIEHAKHAIKDGVEKVVESLPGGDRSKH